MKAAHGERSFWAWGYAGKLPDEDARRALAAQVAAMLGGSDLGLRRLPRLEDAKLPAPRVAPPPELSAFSSASPADRARCTYGKGYRDIARAFALDFSPAPDFVVMPSIDEEVQATLAWCSAARVAAIPFGGGTSVVGGVEGAVGEGYRGVVSIDMQAFSKVKEVDAASRAARIQAGAFGPSIEAQLAEHGLSLRHYPQSFEFSTLGGWIATRSGGHFATLYTHIDDFVQSVRMITPRGPLETRRLPASGAGPSPERLILGSEGALGVITEAWMRVQTKPRYRTSASVFFDDFMAGAGAARALAQAGLYPSNCRLLGAQEALLNGVGVEGGAVLLIGFESADHAMDAWMARALEITSEKGGRCPKGPKSRDEGERGADVSAEAWRKAFLNAPYLQSALVSVGVIADTFETACTWDRFPSLYAGVTEAVEGAMRQACGAGTLMCRFTHVYPDGPAPYFTFIAPGRSGEELSQWAEIKRAASDALIERGATITHHHAVGRLHKPWYDRERPELFGEALRAAKRALDPAGIMNPGALVDPPLMGKP
ncbi:MAG: FAD-binding oxidoreductase [Polyangiaceae bacterium]|nr:FAD-binding oxidoreductase [Polyangiaceae bacterium]